MTAPGFSFTDKLRAIEREITYRKRVYVRMVQEGKMTDGFAAAQVAIMEAIAADYTEMAKRERLL